MPKDIVKFVYQRNKSAILRLLRAGAGLNDRDDHGWTPIMHAVCADDASSTLVQWLIDAGADANAANTEEKSTPLHFAATAQRLDIAQILLAAGASVDPEDIHGNTPLMRCVAAPAPNTELLGALIDAGANIRKQNKYGVSPLKSAAQAVNKIEFARFMKAYISKKKDA